MGIKLKIALVAICGIVLWSIFDLLGLDVFIYYLRILLIPVLIIIYVYVMWKLLGKKVKEKTEDYFST